MKVHLYHPETKEYVGTEEARENPRESGKYLIPEFGTTAPLPARKKGHTLKFDGTRWNAV